MGALHVCSFVHLPKLKNRGCDDNLPFRRKAYRFLLAVDHASYLISILYPLQRRGIGIILGGTKFLVPQSFHALSDRLFTTFHFYANRDLNFFLCHLSY